MIVVYFVEIQNVILVDEVLDDKEKKILRS
jgi:hypothetical protein